MSRVMVSNARLGGFIGIVLALWWGVGSLSAADPLPSVTIAGIPHVKQKPDFCGEACAEMWLRKQQATVDQDYVYDQSGLDPLLGRTQLLFECG